MKYEIYTNVKIADDFSIVEFTSEGKKGSIPKRIVFSATEWNRVYNLAFGDVDEHGEIDDSNVSDNGDRNKVLATVAKVVTDYSARYPERLIIFRGSTHHRTRLYRIAISLNLEGLSSLFNIYSYAGQEIVPFAKDIEADAFLIKRKIS
jgi:hypothetical protein